MIQYLYDYIFVYFIAARCGYDLSCKYKLILGTKCIRELICYITQTEQFNIYHQQGNIFVPPH